MLVDRVTKITMTFSGEEVNHIQAALKEIIQTSSNLQSFEFANPLDKQALLAFYTLLHEETFTECRLNISASGSV